MRTGDFVGEERERARGISRVSSSPRVELPGPSKGQRRPRTRWNTLEHATACHRGLFSSTAHHRRSFSRLLTFARLSRASLNTSIAELAHLPLVYASHSPPRDFATSLEVLEGHISEFPVKFSALQSSRKSSPSCFPRHPNFNKLHLHPGPSRMLSMTLFCTLLARLINTRHLLGRQTEITSAEVLLWAPQSQL